jgi:hypothetical protein
MFQTLDVDLRTSHIDESLWPDNAFDDGTGRSRNKPAGGSGKAGGFADGEWANYRQANPPASGGSRRQSM